MIIRIKVGFTEQQYTQDSNSWFSENKQEK